MDLADLAKNSRNCWMTMIWERAAIGLVVIPPALWQGTLINPSPLSSTYGMTVNKILKIIGGLILLLSLLLVAAHLLFGRDIPPPDLSDLEPERITIADEDNAYTYFIATTNVVYMPEEGWQLLAAYILDEEVDMAVLAEILTKNEETFAGIERALGCKKCIPPPCPIFEGDPLLKDMERIHLLLLARTKLEMASGALSKAVIQLGVQLCFADRYFEYPDSATPFIVGLVCRRDSLRQARDIVRDSRIDHETCERLSAILDGTKPLAPSLVHALRVEHMGLSDLVCRVNSGEFPMEELFGSPVDEDARKLILGLKWIPSFVFKVNETQKILADLFRVMIADASRSYAIMQSPALHEFYRDDLSLWGFDSLSRNAVGKSILLLSAPVQPVILEAKCRSESDLSATRILVACHRYRLREGRFPGKLEDLVPDFLPEVPMDPFDGAPFRYDPVREIVWSVGKDLRDSGGSSTNDGKPETNRWRADDPVYRLTGDADL